jgi:hypothetical protein
MDDCHRLLLTASCDCAAAMMRTIDAATAASALGVGAITDGAAGQTSRTTAGVSDGWCSSTVRWSLRVIWPAARVVDLLMEIGVGNA